MNDKKVQKAEAELLKEYAQFELLPVDFNTYLSKNIRQFRINDRLQNTIVGVRITLGGRYCREFYIKSCKPKLGWFVLFYDPDQIAITSNVKPVLNELYSTPGRYYGFYYSLFFLSSNIDVIVFSNKYKGYATFYYWGDIEVGRGYHKDISLHPLSRQSSDICTEAEGCFFPEFDFLNTINSQISSQIEQRIFGAPEMAANFLLFPNLITYLKDAKKIFLLQIADNVENEFLKKYVCIDVDAVVQRLKESAKEVTDLYPMSSRNLKEHIFLINFFSQERKVIDTLIDIGLNPHFDDQIRANSLWELCICAPQDCQMVCRKILRRKDIQHIDPYLFRVMCIAKSQESPDIFDKFREKLLKHANLYEKDFVGGNLDLAIRIDINSLKNREFEFMSPLHIMFLQQYRRTSQYHDSIHSVFLDLANDPTSSELTKIYSNKALVG